MRSLATLCIVLGAIIALGYCIGQMPSFQSWRENRHVSSKLQFDMSKDPKPGTPVVIDLPDIGGRKISLPGKRTIVVLAGGCSSCALKTIDPRRVTSFQADQLVIDYSNVRAEIPAWAEKLPPKIFVVSDPEHKLDDTLNAVWHPRFVILDNKGRIERISKLDDNWSDIIQSKAP